MYKEAKEQIKEAYLANPELFKFLLNRLKDEINDKPLEDIPGVEGQQMLLEYDVFKRNLGEDKKAWGLAISMMKAVIKEVEDEDN